jgi:hypothetical protein
LIIACIIGALLGAIIGPPLGRWSLRFDHAIERHRATCPACQRRAQRRAQTSAGADAQSSTPAEYHGRPV